MRTHTQARRRQAALLAVAIAAVGVLAACGGSTPKLTVAQQLTASAKADGGIRSGNLTADVALTLNGLKELKGQPVKITVTGPFERQVGTDLQITISAVGSTASLGVDEVGKKLYAGLGGRFYTVPLRTIQSALGGLAGGFSTSGGTTSDTSSAAASGLTSGSSAQALLAKLGFNPRSWVGDWRDLGTVTIAGVICEKLEGQVQIAKVIGDLDHLLVKGSPGSTAIPASSLTLIESAVTTSKIDLYIGSGDHIIRGADLDIAFTVPALVRAEAGGLTGGALSASFRLRGVNAPQTISAPAHPQPYAKILQGATVFVKQLRPALKLLAGTITTSGSASTPTITGTSSADSRLSKEEYTAYLDAKAAAISAGTSVSIPYDTGAKLVAVIVADNPELRGVVNDDPSGREPAGTFTVAGTTPKAFKAVGKTAGGDTVGYSVSANGSSSSFGASSSVAVSGLGS